MELGCTHEEAGLSRGAPYAEKVGSRITDRMQAAEVVTIRYNCNTVAPESNRRLPPDLGAFAHIEWLQRAGIREGAARTPALPGASL